MFTKYVLEKKHTVCWTIAHKRHMHFAGRKNIMKDKVTHNINQSLYTHYIQLSLLKYNSFQWKYVVICSYRWQLQLQLYVIGLEVIATFNDLFCTGVYLHKHFDFLSILSLKFYINSTLFFTD
jgi:hypothetical protein